MLGKEVGLLEELFRLRLQRDSVQGPRQVAYLYHYLHCLLFLMGEKGEKREGGGEGKEGEGMYVGREYCPPCPPSKGYLTKKHQFFFFFFFFPLILKTNLTHHHHQQQQRREIQPL